MLSQHTRFFSCAFGLRMEHEDVNLRVCDLRTGEERHAMQLLVRALLTLIRVWQRVRLRAGVCVVVPSMAAAAPSSPRSARSYLRVLAA